MAMDGRPKSSQRVTHCSVRCKSEKITRKERLTDSSGGCPLDRTAVLVSHNGFYPEIGRCDQSNMMIESSVVFFSVGLFLCCQALAEVEVETAAAAAAAAATAVAADCWRDK